MLGATVIYASHNGDGVLSPAIVLRTPETHVENVVEREENPPFGELGEGEVDLLVHGLVRDYRVYSVPHDPHGSPRTWRRW